MSFKKKMFGFGLLIVLTLFLFWYMMKPAILNYREDLYHYSLRHLYLVFVSMLSACFIGIPIGVALSRNKMAQFSEKLIQIFNVGNAIPTMAVLALCLIMLGIGDLSAIVALVLASLLPIVRNTYEGLRAVPRSYIEAAQGIGMTPWQSLCWVELPNSFPVILGGVRTALAINVGTAPLSFIIGGDSLGGLIFPGIYLNNTEQLILGAVATALMALFLDALVSGLGFLFLKKRGLA